MAILPVVYCKSKKSKLCFCCTRIICWDFWYPHWTNPNRFECTSEGISFRTL